MRIGAVYPQTELGGDPEAVRRIGLAAEELGYDHLLAYDHVLGATHADREPALTGPYTEADPFHDPLVMFAYLAGITTRIEFVTGVLILPQRQVALVARQCADLDLLSGGRLRLGVGTGWNYVEYDSLGTDFASRGPRFDEQLDVLRRFWTEDVVTYRGRFHQVDRAALHPRPDHHIPIWFGGFSEPAFRRAARLGDGFIHAGSREHGRQRCCSARAPPARGWSIERILRAGTGRAGSHGRQRRRDHLRLARAGRSHASVVTMGLGLDSTEAHIDYLAEVRARLG